MNKHAEIAELKYLCDFTEIYKSESDKYLREAKCLRFQIYKALHPLQENDLIAGCMGGEERALVGFSPQYGGIYTYYFHQDRAMQFFKAVQGQLDPELCKQIEACIDFWKEEATLTKLTNSFKNKYGYYINDNLNNPGVVNADGRIAGTTVDIDKLIRLGISGLREEIEQYKKLHGDSTFYQALLLSLDVLCESAELYRKQALSLAEQSAHCKELLALADVLQRIQVQAPKSFYEGLQLFWIYAVTSDLMNFGRLDVAFGDLYVQDVTAGTLDEESAIALFASWYKHLVVIDKVHDSRIIIGGEGRRNPKNADKVALLLMETSRRVKEAVPQLTLRYYKGISDEIYDKALAVNGEGCTFPIIYSDITNIPAVMECYDIPYEEACRYLPFGCGEFIIQGLSVGTPNNGVNLLKALELALFDGYDHFFEKQVGPHTGTAHDIHTIDDLWQAYRNQLEPDIQKIAWYKQQNYDIAAKQAGYLHISLLMDGCIPKGKALLEGGVKYLNASSEIMGITSAADSFMAIKKYVFEEKRFTLSELTHMLLVDFDGYEKERQLLLQAPKYGNDIPEADAVKDMFFNHIADITREAGKSETRLNNYSMVSVNNSSSAEWGYYCIASACGRHKSKPMGNANGPSLGCDVKGMTALLNSMSKVDNTRHVGVINNIRFSSELFKNSYEKIKALLTTFYEHNGVETNIDVVGAEDLQQAMVEPEKYKNLMVRIGGFSARFIELDPVVQYEILNRTTYVA